MESVKCVAIGKVALQFLNFITKVQTFFLNINFWNKN